MSIPNKIVTVKSEISGAELGFCHSHEHLFIKEGQSCELVPSLRLDDFNKTLEELQLYKKSGGASIVDAQPVGCGRMAQALFNVSAATDINIIASTGFHKLVFYHQNHWIHHLNEYQLAELFIGEIQSGMYIDGDAQKPQIRINSKAGIIKTASDIHGPSDEYEKLFIAAARAHKVTGAPILSHVEMCRGAFEQIEIFIKNGVSPSSIILCHLDRMLDKKLLLEVAATGVYLELDTIGRFKYHSDEEEAQCIINLIEQGYEEQILLGLDSTRERMRSYGGNIGLDYIITDFIPLIKQYGLTDYNINKFMIENPSRAFSFKKS